MAGAVLFDFHDTLAHLQASTTAITARAIGVSEAETRSAWLRVEARIRELQHGPGWPPPSEQRWQIIYSWMFEFLGIDGDPQRPLDLLDAFVGQEPSALWLTPKDMHGNPAAHALSVPAYTTFVRGLLDARR